MVILGQARLVVTFARVDDEHQVVEPQDVTYNLPRLDDASFADVKVMVGVHREALEHSLCQQPVSIVDDLPEVEGLENKHLPDDYRAALEELEADCEVIDVSPFVAHEFEPNGFLKRPSLKEINA